MSNQVYSNSQQKYFSQPGVNIYIKDDPGDPHDQTIVRNETQSVTFDWPSAVQFPDIAQVNSDNIVITQSGVYAIRYSMRCKEFDATDNLNATASLYCISTTGATGSYDKSNVFFGSGFAGIQLQPLHLSYTGYLSQGDVISARVTVPNYNASGQKLIILFDGSLLSIAKLI